MKTLSKRRDDIWRLDHHIKGIVFSKPVVLTRGDFAPKGYLAMSGDISDHHKWTYNG